MGRYSTGACTVYESLRIELSYLLKRGFIKKGCMLSFNLSWSDQRGNSTGNISCISSYLEAADQRYLKLIYTLTDRRTGTKTDRCYKVYFCEVDSNLGKGKVLYFLCPQSGRKCRILYSAYGSHLFKSRKAYQHRLYYDCQHSSKLNQYNDNYWRIDAHLKKIDKASCRGRRTYKGELTRKAQRYNWLYEKQDDMDYLRWTAGMPKVFCKRLHKEGL